VKEARVASVESQICAEDKTRSESEGECVAKPWSNFEDHATEKDGGACDRRTVNAFMGAR
jgi:hypothetical protein